MKQSNTHAFAAAMTLAGAVFFGSPLASAQTTAAPGVATPPAPGVATPPPAAPPPGSTVTQTTTTTTTAPAAPPAPVVIHQQPAAPPAQKKVTTPVVVAAGLGVVGLGTGIVFGIIASGKNSNYKKTPDNQTALDGEKDAFISDVGFGVAALFGLTAFALYMLPDEPEPPPAPAGAPPPAAKSNVKKWLTAAVKGEVLSF